MEKYPLHITHYYDEDEYETYYEVVRDRMKDIKVFSVGNLCECPEDARIGRDLFDAQDFIRAVKYGMKLAQEGYTELEVTEETKNRYEDDE